MLSDAKIKILMQAAEPVVSPLPGRYANLNLSDLAWEAYASPIQPSSIDLHAGKIFIPEKVAGKSGSHGNGADAYTIKQGESVIVSTYEQLNLPNNISGIVFPPSGVLSSKAILVSNIGHIDPGFKGCLRFTLINMGSEPFSICSEKVIVGTLLLFEVNGMVEKNWLERACLAGKATQTGGKAEPDQDEIDSLAADFAGMDKRMIKVASEQLTSLRYLKWNAGLPIFLTAIISLAAYFYNLHFGDLGELRKQNYTFQSQMLDQRKQIIELEEKYNQQSMSITDLKEKLAKK